MRQVAPTHKKTGIEARKRLNEGLFILLMAIAIYFFVSLLSYHHTDPGWSNASISKKVANAGGRFGAWFADVFLYFFGYMAYLFPFVFAMPAWSLLNKKSFEQTSDKIHIIFRLMGFLLILFAGCSLINLCWHNIHAHVPLNAGGVLGNIISESLLGALSLVGTSIILVTIILVGIMLFTGLSWLSLGQWLSHYALNSLNFVKNYILNKRKASQEKVSLPSQKKVKEVKTKRVKKQKKSDDEPVINFETLQTNTNDIASTFFDIEEEKPSLSLLEQEQKSKQRDYSQTRLEDLAREVETKLLEFGIEAKVVAFYPGPVITRFELELVPGLKVSKVTALAKDLARSLSQTSVRVVEVIPGKSVIGLEIPNECREFVYLRELLESKQYTSATSPLSLALGKDISGYPVIVDLAKMPHLLIAGTTGSGKSVSLNTMIFSLLFKTTSRDVRFIMVDPKMLELSAYEGIPHLLAPVVTDMKEAVNAFRWCVAEMEKRYRLMASLSVRNLAGFNDKVKRAIKNKKPIPDPLIPEEERLDGDIPTLEPLPYIVIVVDELADMMMVVGKKVEELIARLAQKARAAGIHMILATQRPSVDVITGLIKANIPTRISFQVSSKIDSRTILDQQGAEQLLGYGDMLYLPPGSGLPIRIHGAFISDEELHAVLSDLKKNGISEYQDEILKGSEAENASLENMEDAEQDPLYDKAVNIVMESRRASISYVQRRLKIGYNRAARLLESMEQAGIVSPMEGNGSREVLVPKREEE